MKPLMDNEIINRGIGEDKDVKLKGYKGNSITLANSSGRCTTWDYPSDII